MASSTARTPEEYLNELDPERSTALAQVRTVILSNLPDGYQEVMQYGIIGYVVPFDLLPETYNGQPLAYAALANQKRYMSLYLNGIYGDPQGEAWLRLRFAQAGKRIDMGKSCVRFRRVEDLDLDAIGEAIGRIPAETFIARYRASRNR